MSVVRESICDVICDVRVQTLLRSRVSDKFYKEHFSCGASSLYHDDDLRAGYEAAVEEKFRQLITEFEAFRRNNNQEVALGMWQQGKSANELAVIERFSAHLKILRDTIDGLDSELLQQKARCVYRAAVKLLESGQFTLAAMDNIVFTTMLLTCDDKQEIGLLLDLYKAQARLTQGKASCLWRALGAAMFVLGVAVAVTSGFVFGAGIGVIAGGITACLGIGFFGHGRAFGMSKAMSELECDIRKKVKFE